MTNPIQAAGVRGRKTFSTRPLLKLEKVFALGNDWLSLGGQAQHREWQTALLKIALKIVAMGKIFFEHAFRALAKDITNTINF
jgi:hypothetical protein